MKKQQSSENKYHASGKTLKIGIATYEAFKAAKGEYQPSEDEHKVWFTSLESFAKLLSSKNREWLALIAESQPNSMQELVEKTGRAKSNLSRTLKTLERYGLLYFEDGHGRNLAPRVDYTDLVLDVPLRAP